jgi:hypothetical protein
MPACLLVSGSLLYCISSFKMEPFDFSVMYRVSPWMHSPDISAPLVVIVVNSLPDVAYTYTYPSLELAVWTKETKRQTRTKND